MELVGLMLLSLGLYFLPGIVAMARRHHQVGAIFVLNLFLGWTFIGWVAALVWAATAVRPELRRAPAPDLPPSPPVPDLQPGELQEMMARAAAARRSRPLG